MPRVYCIGPLVKDGKTGENAETHECLARLELEYSYIRFRAEHESSKEGTEKAGGVIKNPIQAAKQHVKIVEDGVWAAAAIPELHTSPPRASPRLVHFSDEHILTRVLSPPPALLRPPQLQPSPSKGSSRVPHAPPPSLAAGKHPIVGIVLPELSLFQKSRPGTPHNNRKNSRGLSAQPMTQMNSVALDLLEFSG
jgi:hypothetical protein